MKVRYYATGSSRSRVAHGPADLPADRVKLILLEGTPAPSDFARWAGAIGIAAMQGAEVRKVKP